MSHIDLCTLELACAVSKAVVATLRVEMRTTVSQAKNGRGYRKLRISPVGASPEAGYEWAAAFGADGDTAVDGVGHDLTIAYKIGDGPNGGSFTGLWVTQDVKVKVRKGGTYRVEILAVAPVKSRAKVEDEPRPGFDARAKERAKADPRDNPFEGFFRHLGERPKAAQPETSNPVWTEIEAVLKRKAYRSIEDVKRARKAIALLLHSERTDAALEMDALAQANAFLDQREKPYREPLAA